MILWPPLYLRTKTTCCACVRVTPPLEKPHNNQPLLLSFVSIPSLRIVFTDVLLRFRPFPGNSRRSPLLQRSLSRPERRLRSEQQRVSDVVLHRVDYPPHVVSPLEGHVPQALLSCRPHLVSATSRIDPSKRCINDSHRRCKIQRDEVTLRVFEKRGPYNHPTPLLLPSFYRRQDVYEFAEKSFFPGDLLLRLPPTRLKDS